MSHDQHDRDHQAPQYQQPADRDSAYQPEPQGDAPQYQPHAAQDEDAPVAETADQAEVQKEQ